MYIVSTVEWNTFRGLYICFGFSYLNFNIFKLIVNRGNTKKTKRKNFTKIFILKDIFDNVKC